MNKERKVSHKETDKRKESENKLVLSYMTLRNLIGFSGFLLPVILIFFTKSNDPSKFILPTISEYYYTNNGDILVVILSVLSVFLITYNGYTPMEKFWMVLAAVCGLGVAFCPMSIEYTAGPGSLHTTLEVPKILGREWHMIFASVFFISISIISLYYFPKSNKSLIRKPGEKRTQKEKRNIVFKVCGIVMLLCVALIGIYFIWIKDIKKVTGEVPVVFIFESLAVWAFAVAWLTKGQTLLPDGEHYIYGTIRDIKKSL
ncbi:MAG: hypothetical protein HOP31_04960 [Ignavibacteria bacterium]|nr:hypothetical protein [Ignavibacteria bacterium]